MVIIKCLRKLLFKLATLPSTQTFLKHVPVYCIFVTCNGVCVIVSPMECSGVPYYEAGRIFICASR
jgi:hypothetical protein